MKKKFVWGSVIVALLMLVSSIAVITTVVSDPTPHTGDADAGSIWITELDVSSIVEEFNDIGVAHTNASNDWVRWENGIGNITVDWGVDIDSQDHPEYYIRYSLVVLNIDDANTEMANDTFTKSYSENRSYDETGTLTASITFDNTFMEKHDEATLLCYLDASVQHNSSQDAVNFTTWAQDRAVIGVSFNNNSLEQPFSRFIKEANENFPSPWCWIDGWDEESRFNNETEMMNQQTVVIGGSTPTSETQPLIEDWYIADYNITVYDNLWPDMEIIPGNASVNWTNPVGSRWALGETYGIVNCEVSPYGHNLWVVARYVVKYDTGAKLSAAPFLGQAKEIEDEEIFGDEDVAADKEKADEDGYIHCEARCTFWSGCIWKTKLINDLTIYVGDEGENSSGTNNWAFCWQETCAYMNGSYDISASGSSTISVDISGGLQLADECVYTFAADRGDTTVQLTC